MSHTCHIPWCRNDAHPEMPFCRECASKLPTPHKEKMWKERPKGECGVCLAFEAKMDSNGVTQEWLKLYDLGVAIIDLLVNPESATKSREDVRDADGFDWMVGVADAEKTYRTAEAVIRKFDLR